MQEVTVQSALQLDPDQQEHVESKTEIVFHISDTTWYSIFVYPFHTLATNRILNTVISRKNSNSMITDFKDMWRIGGRNAIFAGYSTYFLVSVLYTGQIIIKSLFDKN